MIATLFCLALAPQVFTVDDSGGADFTDLPAAIAAVPIGATLKVMPGNYSAFTLAKRLEILGPASGAKPTVAGESKIQNATSVELAGLKLVELIVENMNGRVRIDECEIGHGGISGFAEIATFRLTNCAQAEITRCLLQGKTGDDNWVESPGLEIYGSNAAVVDCQIYGGDGATVYSGFTCPGCGYPGQPGIRIDLASNVIVAGSLVEGGFGAAGQAFCGCPSFSGGAGIEVWAGSTLDLRGSPSDTVQYIGPFSGGFFATFAVSGLGSASISGVTLLGGPTLVSPGITATYPSPARPYLEIAGSAAPGAMRELRLYGPAGSSAVVGVGLAPLLFGIPGLEGLIWLDPSAMLQQFGKVALGQSTPATFMWTMPTASSALGLSAIVQAVFPQAGGTLLATNPSNMVVRF
jgi:hypothetical protein